MWGEYFRSIEALDTFSLGAKITFLRWDYKMAFYYFRKPKVIKGLWSMLSSKGNL